MMSRLILSCITALLIAAPAFAEDGEETAPSVTPLAAQAMYNFAGCTVSNSRRGVVKLLSKDYRSKEYQDAIRQMARGHDRCVPGNQLKFAGVLFAGNLAEHLLTDQFSETALAANLGRDRSAAPIMARSPTEDIAMCIVMRSPSESAALFRTGIATDDEKAALSEIAPQLPNCVKQGVQFKTNRSGLRALLALAAYRIAVTGNDGTAT